MAYNKPLLPSKHFPAFKDNMPTLTGKTFVITGTTSGTGKVAAKALAEKGARVFMLNRKSTRSEKSQQDISTAFPTADISTIECDLQSFASVQRAADQLKEACPDSGIYALINNAGIMAMPDEATAEGFDTQMQTNHLSHFLLTRELYPLLEKGAEIHGEARIVNHSSVARLSVKRLEAKYLEKNGGNLGGNGSSMMFGGARWVRYGQTKHANAAFTAALHAKLTQAGSKVKSLVAHPGFANTELQVTTSAFGGMASWTSMFTKYVSQSEEDGTLGILSCAVLPEAKSGEFWGPGSGMNAMKGEAKPFALEKQYDNPEIHELIWSKSCEAIGKEFVIG
jgi:NAD(P)-dependent dehydrogenase (short-subunit alcohol dehydrogenase family)